MTVLVTGGTGFVGSHLVRVLLERGEEVRCLTRRASRLDNLKDLSVEFVTGDLRDLDSLGKAVKGCNVVYHCAADYRLWCKDPADMYAANVKGSNNVMQASRVADRTAFFLQGKLIEVGPTQKIFVNPKEKITHDYISGRFG